MILLRRSHPIQPPGFEDRQSLFQVIPNSSVKMLLNMLVVSIHLGEVVTALTGMSMVIIYTVSKIWLILEVWPS